MNRGNLVKEVGEALGLSYDVSGHYEQTLLQDLANRGVVDVLLRTHVYIQIGDLSLSAGVSEYRNDTAILAIDDGRGSTPSGIGHYDIVGLDEMISRQSVGYVSSTFRKKIAIEGDLLIVSPTPAANESLRFYYVPRPTAMSSDGNDPSASTYGGIPSEHHDAILEFMFWRAARYEGANAPMKPQEYFQSYLAICGDVRRERAKMRGRRFPPARIGYPGSRRPNQGRNDMYPRAG